MGLKNLFRNPEKAANKARKVADENRFRGQTMLEDLRLELNRQAIENHKLAALISHDDIAEETEQAPEMDIEEISEDTDWVAMGYDDEDQPKEAAQELPDEDVADLNALDDEEGTQLTITPMTIDTYLLNVTALCQYLNDTGVSRIKLTEIDQAISSLADHMLAAVKQVNPRTAEESMEALSWGVLCGRKDLEKVELPRMDDIITRRLERFGSYELRIKTAENIDKFQRQRQALLMEQITLSQTMEAAKQALRAYTKTEISLMITHQKKGDNAMTAKDHDIANKQLRLKNAKDNVEANKHAVLLTDEQIVINERSLATAKTNMLITAIEINEDVPKMMDTLSEQVTRTLSESDEALKALIASSNRLAEILAQHPIPPEMMLEYTKANNALLRDQENEIRLAKEQADEGRKLKAQQMRENAMHKVILTN